jgi:hypothetical protein
VRHDPDVHTSLAAGTTYTYSRPTDGEREAIISQRYTFQPLETAVGGFYGCWVSRCTGRIVGMAREITADGAMAKARAMASTDLEWLEAAEVVLPLPCGPMKVVGS